VKFSEIQLHPLLQANLDKIKFVDCTPIQEQAIPLLRKGKDLSGLAQTGTGKTGAFLIPLMDRILKSMKPEAALTDSETIPFVDWKRRNYVLILVPTRELAEQVQENAKSLLENTGLSSVSIYGGTTYEKQVAALKQGVEFVIATPGRFIDLYKEHVADLGMVRAVIFDEADRMFDMGFRDDMKFILRRLPRERQFLVFSATLNFEVLNVAYENGADPVEINISRDKAKAENVKDYMIHLGQEDKPRYLLSLLRKFEPRQTIIFSNFKHNVERIAKFLTSNNIPAMGISSLLTQAQRNRVMEQFKAENEKNILVATDVAARGLDILGVDLVINFDLPDDPENYVHRIGRTGRAGQTGQALSMVGDRDVDALQRVEEFLGNKLETIWLDDAEIITEFQAFPRDEGRRGPPKRNTRDERPRGGGGEQRGGSGPRAQGPRQAGGGRGGSGSAGRPDRDRGPRREGPAPQRPRPNEGASGGRPESHRDRASGRHAGQPSAATGGKPQRRDQNPRGPSAGGGARPPQQPRRHTNGNGRPHPPRPQTPRPSAARLASNKSIGQKVSGFLKKIFGKES
jgi:superfamily II DNA/RNA helicase